MLILPDGYKEWNKQVEKYAPDLEKEKKRWFEPDQQRVDSDGSVCSNERPADGLWHLPKTWCPGCQRNDWRTQEHDDKNLHPSPGLYMFDEPRLDLDCTVDTQVIYYVCPDCAKQLTNADKALAKAAELAQLDAEEVVRREQERLLIQPTLLSLPGVTAQETQEQKYERRFMQSMEERVRRDRGLMRVAKLQAAIEENICEWIRARKLAGEAPLERLT